MSGVAGAARDVFEDEGDCIRVQGLGERSAVAVEQFNADLIRHLHCLSTLCLKPEACGLECRSLAREPTVGQLHCDRPYLLASGLRLRAWMLPS